MPPTIPVADPAGPSLEELGNQHGMACWRLALGATCGGLPEEHGASVARTAVHRALVGYRGSPTDELGLTRPRLLQVTRAMALGVIAEIGETPWQSTGKSLPDVYRRLPETWRAAMWLTIVEGLPPATTATILGLDEANTGALAAQAVSGLRRGVLRDGVADDDECAAYTAVLCSWLEQPTALDEQEAEKAEAHVATCRRCRSRVRVLSALEAELRVMAPAPAGGVSTLLEDPSRAHAPSARQGPAPTGPGLAGLQAARPAKKRPAKKAAKKKPQGRAPRASTARTALRARPSAPSTKQGRRRSHPNVLQVGNVAAALVAVTGGAAIALEVGGVLPRHHGASAASAHPSSHPAWQQPLSPSPTTTTLPSAAVPLFPVSGSPPSAPQSITASAQSAQSSTPSTVPVTSTTTLPPAGPGPSSNGGATSGSGAPPPTTGGSGSGGSGSGSGSGTTAGPNGSGSGSNSGGPSKNCTLIVICPSSG